MKVIKMKTPLIGVEYIKEADGSYTLYTCNDKSATKIGARYDNKHKCYVAKGKKKAQGAPYKIKYASKDSLKKLKALYEVYQTMLQELDQRAEAAEQQEDRMVKFLLSNGLKLKPGKIRDRQLLASDSVRLHHCQAVFKRIDTEAAEELIAAHPEIEACFVERTVRSLDKAALNELLPSLPAAASRAIEKFEIQETFREIQVPKGDCDQCGGRIRKNGTCKHCGFQHKAPQLQKTTRLRRPRHRRAS